MRLRADLAGSRTEEDVKDAYIKALSLTGYTKGLIDIQTEEIWFEAKETATPPVLMFAQLLFYVRDARKKGERIPPFLAVIDREKAAIMETAKALPLMTDKSIKWPKSASAVDKSVAAQVAPYIETHFVVFKIDSHEKEFVAAVKAALKAGKFVRTPITPDNLRQVFDKWVQMVGSELDGVRETDYALLFFADVMHDGSKPAMANLPARLVHEGDKPLFLLNDKTYELASEKGYRNFWAIYHRPPEEAHRAYLLERRDSLLPIDERSFKGAYYTPLHIVDKAYNLLAETLGANWQQNYVVWDMCCGVGNLEVKHSNHRQIFMSTLDKADIDVMAASRTCVAATKFQYDYLNDDVDEFGNIDYSRTGKVPQILRDAIEAARLKKKGAKRILVLMNPPYGEANSGDTRSGTGKNKTDIANTAIGSSMDGWGYAARELFVQFLVRIQRELPGATIAMFSTLKYVNAPNFVEFRDRWSAKYLNGFVVHSRAFDGLNGDFPIGFLVWDTSKPIALSSVTTKALDKDGYHVGEKSFRSAPSDRFLSAWLPRLKTTAQNVPLKNAIVPQQAHAKVTSWHAGSIGYFLANANDLQNSSTLTALLSSVYSAGNGFYVTRENVWKVAVMFAVRRLIKPTWLNNRDQFLQPTSTLTSWFKLDCLVWMLFNGSNLSAGADGLDWNGSKWSLVNHFIPFSEKEVGASGRFESDFMSRYLADAKISSEGKDVLREGRKLWKKYHSIQFEKKLRNDLKLNRADAGWYQIRMALAACDEAIDFEPFKTAYDQLTRKLVPQVYDLGFLDL
jgi:hypothetical protein